MPCAPSQQLRVGHHCTRSEGQTARRRAPDRPPRLLLLLPCPRMQARRQSQAHQRFLVRNRRSRVQPQCRNRFRSRQRPLRESRPRKVEKTPSWLSCRSGQAERSPSRSRRRQHRVDPLRTITSWVGLSSACKATKTGGWSAVKTFVQRRVLIARRCSDTPSKTSTTIQLIRRPREGELACTGAPCCPYLTIRFTVEQEVEHDAQVHHPAAREG